MVVMRWAVAIAVLLPVSGRTQTAADHFRAGRAALDSGKAESAVKAFEKAVSADGKNAEYHLWLGRALGAFAQNVNMMRQGILARRIKAEFEKTVQLDSGNIGAREGLLQFYLQAPGVMGGSVGKAREQAESIARIAPLRGHVARASIATHEKDQAAAERECRAAVRAFPDSVSAVTMLVNLLTSTNRPDDAFAALDAFLTRKPGDVVALFWVGRTAAVTGRQLDRGEHALRAVLAAPGIGTDAALPAPANAHFRLGEIAAKRGARDVARREFEEALRLNPRLEQARRALREL